MIFVVFLFISFKNLIVCMYLYVCISVFAYRLTVYRLHVFLNIKSLSFHGHLLVLLAVLQNQSRQRQRTARGAHHQLGHAETAEKH